MINFFALFASPLSVLKASDCGMTEEQKKLRKDGDFAECRRRLQIIYLKHRLSHCSEFNNSEINILEAWKANQDHWQLIHKIARQKWFFSGPALLMLRGEMDQVQENLFSSKKGRIVKYFAFFSRKAENVSSEATCAAAARVGSAKSDNGIFVSSVTCGWPEKARRLPFVRKVVFFNRILWSHHCRPDFEALWVDGSSLLPPFERKLFRKFLRQQESWRTLKTKTFKASQINSTLDISRNHSIHSTSSPFHPLTMSHYQINSKWIRNSSENVSEKWFSEAGGYGSSLLSDPLSFLHEIRVTGEIVKES